MINDSTETVKYWFALSRIKNLGAVKTQSLIENFGSVKTIFNASITELESFHKLGKKFAQEIINASVNIARYEKIIEQISILGIDILCPDSLEYPYLLKYIKAPPLILYKKGNIPKADEKTIAIVGTRFPTKEGSIIAGKVAEYFSGEGIIVVSGLAKGIDASAHNGSLKFDGKTIAVIGSGLRNIYPSENTELAEKICKKGTLLSECQPNEMVSKGRLIQRNRITSGISLGVILIEPERGALNTACWALNQNRLVFVFDSENNQKNLNKKFVQIRSLDELGIIIDKLNSFDHSTLAVSEKQLRLF